MYEFEIDLMDDVDLFDVGWDDVLVGRVMMGWSNSCFGDGVIKGSEMDLVVIFVFVNMGVLRE